MTTATLFNQLKAGKITKEKFLYEVRRDQNLPFISPLTTFKEAIQILQNKGIIFEVFEMGSMEEDNDTLTKGAYRADKLGSDVMGEGSEKCSCGGNYETHEDAGEMVCAACGDRQPMNEFFFFDRDPEEFDNDSDDEDVPFDPIKKAHSDYESPRDRSYNSDAWVQAQKDEMGEDDKEEYDPFYDREEEINYGVEDDEKPSLREQVQDFIKKAIEGGSSMDEAKKQAREYFSKEPAALNEDASQAAAVSKAVGEKVKFDDYDANDRPIFLGKNPDIEYTVDSKGNIYKHDGNTTKKVGTLNEAKKHVTIDTVNPYEFKKGVNIEMGVDKSAAPDWSSYLGNLAGDIQKAQAKVLKNLAKDPAYYTNMIAAKGKEKKAPKVKADGHTKAPQPKVIKEGIEDQWKPGTQFKNLKNNQVTTIKKFDDLGNVIVTTDAWPGKEWTWPGEELSNMIQKGELELVKVQKEAIPNLKEKTDKIKEYVKAQLKKEAGDIVQTQGGDYIGAFKAGQGRKVAQDLKTKGITAVTKTVNEKKR